MASTLSPQEIVDRAQRAYQAGDYLLAVNTYTEAAKAYADAGDPLMAAEMKNNQSVALLVSGDAQAALEVVEGTEAVFAESKDFRRQGMAWANQASALEALKRKQDAISFYKNAADALEKADEGDMRAEVMQLLATLYLRHFKIYDAVIALQSGLAGVKNPTSKQRLMKKILFIKL